MLNIENAVVLYPKGGLYQIPGLETHECDRAGEPIDLPGGFGLVLMGGSIDISERESGDTYATIHSQFGRERPVLLYGLTGQSRISTAGPASWQIQPLEALDAAISWQSEKRVARSGGKDPVDLVDWLRGCGPFWQLPLDSIAEIAGLMQPMAIASGHAIVTQGEPGDRFYVIVEGRAEVWRENPLTDEAGVVAVLGPGNTFGEEALIQEANRNATVTSLEPMRLLTLDKASFDRYLNAAFVPETPASDAWQAGQDGSAVLIDCRYDIEHEVSRIPGSLLMPLDRIRESSRILDPGRRYLVYCRSGRRSRAAVFIMRQAGLEAESIAGGIANWPYAIEGDADAH